MKTRSGSILVLLGIFIAMLMAAALHQSAQAKDCFDAQNKPIPCPNYKNPTQPSAPTATFTATSTPTPTATSTATATPLPPDPAANVPPPSGFACPPYASGAPIGAGAMLVGLGTLALARRGLLDANRLRYMGDSRMGSAPAQVSRSATVMGSGSNSAGWNLMEGLNRRLSAFGDRGGPVPDLPSMNQQVGAGAGASRLIGSAISGLGAGLLGSALLGGLLGVSCAAAPLVLPAGAVLGSIGWIALQIGGRPPRDGDMGGDGTYSTFERIGSIDSSGNPSGSSGLYKNLPLE